MGLWLGLPGLGLTAPAFSGSGPPTITSSNSASIAENATLSKGLTANQTVTWSIVGGADQAEFEISGSTLRWASDGTQDYEDPADADTDNAYVVTVRATNETTGLTADQTITATVTDVAELWTPDSLSSLKFWVKGDDLSGSNGDPIASWPNALGGGNDATQATSTNRPTLDVAELNSLNVVDFDPTTNPQWFDLPNIFSAYTAGAAIFVIKKQADPASGAGRSGGPLKLGTQGSSNHNNHYPFDDGNVYDDFGSTVRKSVGNDVVSLATWHIGSFHSASASWKHFVNGVEEFSTGTNTVAFRTNPLLGKQDRGGSEDYMYGKMAEVCIFDAFLSDSDRQKVEGYLAHKWGLTAGLDAGHPYKSSPPTP